MTRIGQAKCKWCGYKTTTGGIIQHEKNCLKNPANQPASLPKEVGKATEEAGRKYAGIRAPLRNYSTPTIKILKAFIAGAKWASEGVANHGEEKNDNYWKQRCEAAEEVIKVMNVPKNKTGENTLTGHGNDQFCLFAERNHKWQSLKDKEGKGK